MDMHVNVDVGWWGGTPPRNDFSGEDGVKRKKENPTTKKHDIIITIKARTPGVASAIL